jgi:hypothetical protein
MSVGVYWFMLEGVRVWLIDTPGFDDTNRSDSEVLKDVAFWLAAAYSKETRLAGIIYLHRIIDVRMLGSALRNLRMFKQLCGANNLDSVILATTHWTDHEGKPIPEAVGQKRTKELVETDEFWGGMIKKGSRMVRHDGTVESARRIVSELVGRRIRVVLDIQRQLVDDKKILYDTDAGQALQSELIEERKRSEAKIAELELDMKDALNDKDESWQKRIAEETSKLEADVAKKVAEGEEMKINMQKMIEEREETLRKMTEKMDQDRQHFSEELQKSTTRFQAFEEEQRQKQIQHQKEMREAEARNDKAEEERRKREWEKDQREANRHAAAMKKQADDHAREMAKIDLEKRKSKEFHYDAIIAVSRALTGALRLGLALIGLGPGF